MKRKTIVKYILISVLLVALIAVASISSVYVYRSVEKKQEQEEQKIQEDIDTAANELQNIIEKEGATMEEIEKSFDEYFPKFDKNTATGFIDSLAYLTYYNISVSGELSESEIDSVYDALNTEGVYNEELMANAELKEKLAKLLDYHAIIKEINGEIAISVDYHYFIDTYGKYMEDDYKSIFEFYAEEQDIDYFDVEKDTFYCDVLVERIEKLCNLLDEYKGSSLYDVFASTKDFYMKEYLGLYSPGKVFDENNKLKDYMKESYEKVAADSKSPICETIKDILDAYSNSKYKKNADVETLIMKAANATETEAATTTTEETKTTETTKSSKK